MIIKGCSTCGSRMITHCSTRQACRCLTSQIGRDGVLSPEYGRIQVLFQNYYKEMCHFFLKCVPKCGKMQPPGIEPGSKPWEGSIMPLDHGCLHVSRVSGLVVEWLPATESARVRFSANAFFANLGKKVHLNAKAPPVGLEPTTTRLRVLRSTD
jgi:hypothetical protein